MHSTESKYLEDDKATGFMKYYKGGKYAFAAMLPKEVYLVRPFVHMLIDCENNIPFFIGTMMDFA